ncbi:hypothetical protein [Polyangium jinanense]|uniref:Uncharacterized protein n=1 Tax=Polyangium jinanense TaxID=2829994 RepID=A0A9X3WYU7_9BACT|nr:hypothetical protein [Polyangium jinanense]MDC3953144.1 hypothetical protein [Polyangium jinanense]MDC3979735.1 hypothetical protein [Polyangium jinanense]
MKTKVQLFFHGTEVPGREQIVLEPAGCGPDVARVSDIEWQGRLSVFVYVTLNVDDPRLALLQKLLLAYKVDWSEERWDEYTDEDFDAARLILARPLIEIDVNGGPRFGTDYDLSSACPACGAGMRQTSAFVIDGAYPEEIGKLEKSPAVASNEEILVNERLAEVLEGTGLSGLSFRSVYVLQKDKRQTKLPWRQMWASHTLPPMSPRSTGVSWDRACKTCGRSKLERSSPGPLRVAYRAQDLVGAQDVNRMWERFGHVQWNGDLKTAVLGQPFFLVTPKVWRIFRDAGVTGFQWIPIRVVEEE